MGDDYIAALRWALIISQSLQTKNIQAQPCLNDLVFLKQKRTMFEIMWSAFLKNFEKGENDRGRD